MKVIPKY